MFSFFVDTEFCLCSCSNQPSRGFKILSWFIDFFFWIALSSSCCKRFFYGPRTVTELCRRLTFFYPLKKCSSMILLFIKKKKLVENWEFECVVSTDCLSASTRSGNSYGFKATGYLRWVVFCMNPSFFMNPCGREEGGQRPLYAAGVFAEWLCCFSPREEVEAGERETSRRRRSSLRWAASWGTREGWRMMPRWQKLRSWEDQRDPSSLKTVVEEKCWFDCLKANIRVSIRGCPSCHAWAGLQSHVFILDCKMPPDPQHAQALTSAVPAVGVTRPQGLTIQAKYFTPRQAKVLE